MTTLTNKLRYLLFQIRNPGDPMREQEVRAFSRALGCEPERITDWDILQSLPDRSELDRHDMVLIGGSGHYSATSTEPWIDPILDEMRELCARQKPTFASCWGFQSMARAMGGRVINDLSHAELGTHTMRLTAAGREDPIFGPLGLEFRGQMGHEDRVAELPPGAVLLASTDRVENQAYRMEGMPIYCTQFHAELNREDLMGRVRAYPEYIERIAGLPIERFSEMLQDTPETEHLVRRFVEVVF